MGNDKRKKQYKDGYTHLPTNLDIKDWDYVYQIHKNNNGTHFDLRLYCPSDSESVFSFSAKHNVLDRNFPTPLRRNRDHTQDTLTFEGTFQSKKGKTNTLATIESGEATLIDIDNRVLISQRPVGKSMSGLWEFPGGKLQKNETNISYSLILIFSY